MLRIASTETVMRGLPRIAYKLLNDRGTFGMPMRACARAGVRSVLGVKYAAPLSAIAELARRSPP